MATLKVAKLDSLPVLDQFTVDSGADEVTVLLQLVQGLLDRLVDGLLNRLTHDIDLVHAATRLGGSRTISRMNKARMSDVFYGKIF